MYGGRVADRSFRGKIHMSSFFGPNQRITRRRLFEMGGAGALASAVPGTVTARVDATRGFAGAADRSVIFVLLCGGPSHLDTWDLKPDAPEDIRGPYK